MAEKNNTVSLDAETIATIKKVLEYKIAAEANIVSIIYRSLDHIYNTNLSLNDFNNNIWRVYFAIVYDLIYKEKKTAIDEIVVGVYLEKHPKLKEKYEEYGGYTTIDSLNCIKTENFDAYVTELRKWKAVILLCKNGFPVKENLSDFVDMTAEQIYNKYESFLNDIFGNIDSDVKSYDLCDGIDELIEKLDEGFALGLSYYNMPSLTDETGGQYLGAITLVGGVSNAGKSTFVRSTTIPSIIEAKERVVIMINEDSFAKWQREMLVWVCNNILKFDIQKRIVRNGRFSKEVKNKLYEAAQWLKNNTKNHVVTIIPFLQYKTEKAIKQFRKYASMGVKYFILDTFKMDAGKVSGNSWLEMQQAMVAIKDVVKAEALNVHALITFQLEKSSSIMRYYTQNNIGLAKNIVDVASTCIMARDLFEDEYTGGKRELKVYRCEGKNGRTKIAVNLSREKKYQIFFIVKNQEGSANFFQIVAHHDKSRNIIEEVGITNISPDSF